MRRAIFVVPIILMAVIAMFLLRPAGRITFDKTTSDQRLLITHELDSSGPFVVRVLGGGEQISVPFRSDYPTVSANEVVFTDDSDTPEKDINSSAFCAEGISAKEYIVEGEVVGVTNGAVHHYFEKQGSKLSDLPYMPEFVPLFRADKWYFVSYVPYMAIGNLLYVWGALAVILLCVICLMIGITYRSICRKSC